MLKVILSSPINKNTVSLLHENHKYIAGVFFSFHASPAHHTAHRMISYLPSSENDAKTWSIIFCI